MADPQTVIEGTLKYRDGKKWKPRWCVIRKLSPVADCLHLQLYRDSKDRCHNGPTKASLSLEGFLGMETGFTLDKESNTMALICQEVVVVLAFDSRELLIQWQVKIRANLIEEQQFLVQIALVPSKSKLTSGPARLHLQDYSFCLTAGVPPRLLGMWPLKELRRFGVVDGKFCFEGGSKCAKGEGLHVLLTNQSKDLAQGFDLASRGRLLGKRKAPVKKQTGLDNSFRMSLQPKPTKKDSELCSTESTKPLLSSGSDGSCDGCTDAMANEGGLDNPLSSTNSSSLCRIHYRWPSCIVPCGPSSLMSPSETEGETTLDGDQGGHQGSLSRGTIPSSLGVQPENQALWAVGQCTKCGQHYCRRCSLTLGDTDLPADVLMSENSGFSPQWTMDLGVLSPSKEGTVHPRNAGRYRNKAPHDRSSLCSQSSQSSGTSSASTSSSEYSVPRSCLESFYDRPRSIHHVIGQSGSTSLPKDAHRNLGPIQETLACSCKESAMHTLPGEIPVCTCWRKGNRRDGDPPSLSSSESSNASPSTSPKKQSFLPQLFQVPFVLPCTCGKAKPYVHYAVPRSALTNMLLMERKQESLGDKTPGYRAEDEYDVPRRSKDESAPERGELLLTNANQCSTETLEENGNLVPSSKDQENPCPCQRLIVWPGNTLSCQKTDKCENININNSNASFQRTNQSQRSVESSLKGLCNCRTKHSSGVPQDPSCTRSRFGKSDNANHIYVNLQYLHETVAVYDPRTNQIRIPHYENLQFIETLPLYENANFILARVTKAPDIEEKGSKKNPRERNPPTSFQSCSVCRLRKRRAVISGSTQRNKSANEDSGNSVYELMSFEEVEEDSSYDSNYLLMQPIYSEGLTESTSEVKPGSKTDSQAPIAEVASGSSDQSAGGDSSLPLRPFMPVLLPFAESTNDDEDPTDLPGYRTQLLRRFEDISDDPLCRSSRSSSLGDLKKKVFLRTRSSSAEGRKSQSVVSVADSEDCTPSSPKNTPIRKHPLLSKLSFRSKEKSFSTDEITPPSSAPTSPDSIFIDNMRKYPFHRSADCLQLKEEYRLSEEDLTQDLDAVHCVDAETKVKCPSGIKRSSSVPCKSHNTQYCASSTDSGISNSLIGESGAVFSHFVSFHGSLPRHFHCDHQQESQNVQEGFKSQLCSPKHESASGKSLSKVRENLSQMIMLSECKQCHQLISSPERIFLLDAKSLTSSSSSDMSDYIETLSLCSRSSTSSGSSNDYVRTEDLCGTLMKIPLSCTSALRPRSGREYHTVDRNALQEECPHSHGSTLHFTRLKPFSENEMAEGSKSTPIKTNSPSPGYVSSSPGTSECVCSPPEKNNPQFVFPKASKELNYLEVSMNELEVSASPTKTNAVQYAVIDVVATAAAKKLSSERENRQMDFEASNNPSESKD